MSAQPDSRYAVFRLLITLMLMTIGSGGMFVMVVVLPQVQAEFVVPRATASIPYTLTMIGFGVGGVFMGRLADRFGVMIPLLLGALGLGLGFTAAANSSDIWQFSIAHGLIIGALGISATFAPLIADTSLWFIKRRGIAVGICASGNYIAGAVWPPIAQHLVQSVGWRQTYIDVGLFSATVTGALALLMAARPPLAREGPPLAMEASNGPERPFGLAPAVAQALLCVAGLACCVAMAMPQVHIVAYCGDLGFGAAHGAQMLSLMLACGIVSRSVSGAICDRIGGLRTLLLGSTLQTLALLLFLPFDGLASLYVISALFGLFQGGLTPSYAIIVREYFPPSQAGSRVGTILMFTMFGMALGGWMSGEVFDLTGSYHAAFINGIAWNLLNLGIVVILMRRVRGIARRGTLGSLARSST